MKQKGFGSKDELGSGDKPEDTEEYYFQRCLPGELTQQERNLRAKLKREYNHRQAVRAKVGSHCSL